METYNEKQIKLNREMREKREQAFSDFNAKRQEMFLQKERAGKEYDAEKKQLQMELDNILHERMYLKTQGMTITNEQYQVTIQREQEVHKAQAELKMRFMDSRREYARADNLLLEEYRNEKMKIAAEKTERLLIIEKEEKERKLLTLANEEEKED